MVQLIIGQPDSQHIAPPPYTTPTDDASSIGLSIVSDPSGTAFLVTLSPPKEPSPHPDDVSKLGLRAPVDIVLVVDVSNSMGELAPAPDANELTSVTIFDVAKQAARMVVASMRECDRVSIVTFNNSAKIVFPLTRTDEGRKHQVTKIVEELQPEGGANIWNGLNAGMHVLTSRSDEDRKAQDQSDSISPQRLASIFLLTAGQPTVDPPGGHIAMLKRYLQSHPLESARFAINTFGFGYGIDSQLLNDIAIVGQGTYGFLPDAGMVGTVFIHALANTYATFCDDCRLSVELEDQEVAEKLEVLGGLETVKTSLGVEIDLGVLQYGQTKDVVLKIAKGLGKGSLTARAKYRPWSSPAESLDPSVTSVINSSFFSQTPDHNLIYHMHRVAFVEALLAPSDKAGILLTLFGAPTSAQIQRLSALAKAIRRDYDEAWSDKAPQADALALARDIEGEVIMALSGKNDRGTFDKWGRHYLPPLARSHQRQQCSNFKDEGLQVYGRDSPLFIKSRNEMNTLFNSLPYPTSTYKGWSSPHTSPPRKPAHEVGLLGLWAPPSFNEVRKAVTGWHQSPPPPCFSGHSLVALAGLNSTGDTSVRVDELRRGVRLQTPAGPRSVAAIVRTATVGGEAELCSVGEGGLLLTPWHPIRAGEDWCFPADICSPRKAACEAVYSILLEPDQDSEAHSVWIGGVLCVTLGHGIVRSGGSHGDIRAHNFLGDCSKVVASMAENPAFFEEAGVLQANGALKSRSSGQVCGFSWWRADMQSQD